MLKYEDNDIKSDQLFFFCISLFHTSEQQNSIVFISKCTRAAAAATRTETTTMLTFWTQPNNRKRWFDLVITKCSVEKDGKK